MHFKNIFIFNILNLVVADLNSTLRAGRIYNPIVQLVNFPNDPCTGASTSLTGICYSPEDCAGVSGGYADGKCAQGFGVCCVIRCQYTDSSNLQYSPRREDFPFLDAVTFQVLASVIYQQVHRFTHQNSSLRIGCPYHIPFG